jgi:hypothetical protein
MLWFFSFGPFAFFRHVHNGFFWVASTAGTLAHHHGTSFVVKLTLASFFFCGLQRLLFFLSVLVFGKSLQSHPRSKSPIIVQRRDHQIYCRWQRSADYTKYNPILYGVNKEMVGNDVSESFETNDSCEQGSNVFWTEACESRHHRLTLGGL